jgi:hypothetical protein
MSGLSEPTVGVPIEGGRIMRESDLRTLLLKAGIYYHETHDDNKPHLICWRLLRAGDQALDGDETAARGLLTFAAELVQRTVPDPENPPPWFRALRDAFLADGYELTWDTEPPRIEGSEDLRWRTPGSIRYKILPTDAAPVPPGKEISAPRASHEGAAIAHMVRFRMQVITATSRSLLKRFPS